MKPGVWLVKVHNLYWHRSGGGTEAQRAALRMGWSRARWVARRLRRLGYRCVRLIHLIPRGSGGTGKSKRGQAPGKGPRSPRTKR